MIGIKVFFNSLRKISDYADDKMVQYNGERNLIYFNGIPHKAENIIGDRVTVRDLQEMFSDLFSYASKLVDEDDIKSISISSDGIDIYMRDGSVLSLDTWLCVKEPSMFNVA